MKRVLKITATNGGTTAKVRIEVVCRNKESHSSGWSPRALSHEVLHAIASGVMQTITDADYFKVPLSKQRVDR